MKTDHRITYYRIVVVLLVIFIVQDQLFAQSDWQPLIDQQENFQKNAMLVLGGWGLSNAITGGIGIFNSEGQMKYFHQMNAGWGVINAGIAAFGYYGAQNLGLEDPISLTLMNKNLSISKAFLFNTGLDVGYIMGGLYLRERARNTSELPERLRGFGNSIIMQGSFLFGFDLIAYFLNNKNTIQIQDAIFNVGSSENGLGLIIQF